MPYYANKTTLDSITDSYQCQVAVAIYLRVRKGTGRGPDGQAQLVLAGITDAADGVAMQPGAIGQTIMVAVLNAASVAMGIAAAVIAAGDLVYADANGTVGTTNTNRLIGRAVTPAFIGERFTYSVVQ